MQGEGVLANPGAPLFRRKGTLAASKHYATDTSQWPTYSKAPLLQASAGGCLQAADGAAINLTALSLAYRDHSNNQAAVDYFIDQPVADGAELDLVAVGHVPELVGFHSGVLKAFFQLLGELQLNGVTQLAPLLERLSVELQGVLSRLRRLAR